MMPLVARVKSGDDRRKVVFPQPLGATIHQRTRIQAEGDGGDSDQRVIPTSAEIADER